MSRGIAKDRRHHTLRNRLPRQHVNLRARFGGDARGLSGRFLTLPRLPFDTGGPEQDWPVVSRRVRANQRLGSRIQLFRPLKNAHLTWDEQTLDKFLENPSGLVHGTKMLVTVRNADTRQRVIAYLKSLSPQSATTK